MRPLVGGGRRRVVQSAVARQSGREPVGLTYWSTWHRPCSKALQPDSVVPNGLQTLLDHYRQWEE
eukprot:8934341-Lingulodinium_polyedra.AAC.1